MLDHEAAGAVRERGRRPARGQHLTPDPREALERAFEQFARGDFRSVTSLYHPDVDWIEHRGVPGAGEFAGVEAVRTGFRGWLSSWRDYRLELLELLGSGDRWFAAVRGSGHGTLSGAFGDDSFFQVWTFRDGKVSLIENFAGRDEALERLR